MRPRRLLYEPVYPAGKPGGVRLDLGDGRELTADFLLDGHAREPVHRGRERPLSPPGVDASFVALSADFVAQRAYAIVANGALEHVAFLGNDFVHPVPNAQTPNDAFELPAISDPVSKLGKRMVIGTRNYLRYGSCTTQSSAARGYISRSPIVTSTSATIRTSLRARCRDRTPAARSASPAARTPSARSSSITTTSTSSTRRCSKTSARRTRGPCWPSPLHGIPVSA